VPSAHDWVAGGILLRRRHTQRGVTRSAPCRALFCQEREAERPRITRLETRFGGPGAQAGAATRNNPRVQSRPGPPTDSRKIAKMHAGPQHGAGALHSCSAILPGAREQEVDGSGCIAQRRLRSAGNGAQVQYPEHLWMEAAFVVVVPRCRPARGFPPA